MQRATPLPTTRRTQALGVATALMCALAGGAVWCLLSLYARTDLAGFAFLVALLIAWALRTYGFAGHAVGGALAALCVALATLYAFSLQAVAQVAGLVGLSMSATFVRISPAMALDIAWSNLRGENAAIVVVAIALAAVLVTQRSRADHR